MRGGGGRGGGGRAVVCGHRQGRRRHRACSSDAPAAAARCAGEKEERLEELLEDVQDIKGHYRHQIEFMASQLTALQQRVEAGSGSGPPSGGGAT